MDLTRTAVRALAGACALSLLITACGGDSEDSAEVVDDTEETTESTEAAEDDTTTTSAADETTTTEADEPEEPDAGGGPDTGAEGDPDAVALAQRINLTIDDFDEAWTEGPPQEDDGRPTVNDCFTDTDFDAAVVGKAETGSFAYEPDADAVQVVTMQTAVLDAPETAEAIVAEFRADAFALCASDIMANSFGEGAEASVVLRPDEPAWTEESLGLVGDVTLPAGDGTTVSGVVDLHVLRTAEVVTFTAIIEAGDIGFEALLGEVYGAIADRHAAELG